MRWFIAIFLYPTLAFASVGEIGQIKGSGVLERGKDVVIEGEAGVGCLLYTSPSPRDATLSRMPSSA